MEGDALSEPLRALGRFGGAGRRSASKEPSVRRRLRGLLST
jgi:hypothetical protein